MHHTTNTIEQPYATGRTRSNIERALADAGKQTATLQPSDLAMLEDFHSLGRLATAALIDLAQISASDRVLDAGTGIGGTARLIAAERGAHVTAVDLTPEYCEVADMAQRRGRARRHDRRPRRRCHRAPVRGGLVRRRDQPARPDEHRGQAPALRRGASRPRARRSPRALGRDRRLRWAAAPTGPVGDVARAEPSRHPRPARRAAPRGRLRHRPLERPHRAGRAGHARSSSPASDRRSDSTCSSRTFRPRRPTSYAT